MTLSKLLIGPIGQKFRSKFDAKKFKALSRAKVAL